MADKTITQLDAATSLSGSDVFPVVHNDETQQASLSTIFSYAPLLNISGAFNVVGGVETVSSGSISTAKTTTTVSNGSASNVNVTLGAGTDGLVKIIVGTGLTNTVTVTSSYGNNWSSIVFNNGTCVMLYFLNNSWNILSKYNG